MHRSNASLVGAVAALLLLVVACGQGGSSIEVLTGAADTASEAGTVRFATSMDSSVPLPDGTQGGLRVESEGEADLETRRFATTATTTFDGIPQAPPSMDMEVVLDTDAMYVRSPTFDQLLPTAGSWVRIDLDAASQQTGFDLRQLLQQGNNDPTAFLELLRGTAEVEELGEEEIRGVVTTHYRATIDRDAALELLSDDLRDQVEAMMEQMQAPDQFPVEAWIDHEGLLRRYVQDLTMTAPGTTTPVEQHLEMELFDYGAEVDIQAPPESEVVDIQDIGPGSGGAPSPGG